MGTTHEPERLSVSGYSGIISLQMVNCSADVCLLTAVLKRNIPVIRKTEWKCHMEGLRKRDGDSQVLCVLRDGKAVSAGMQLSLSEPAILPPLRFTERGKTGKTIHPRVDLSHSSHETPETPLFLPCREPD